MAKRSPNEPDPGSRPRNGAGSGLMERARVRALAALVRLHQPRRPRRVRVMGVELEVRPGVLSPAEIGGFSPSTFFARHLGVGPGERVLDLGTGSGLLAILAARAGAEVTAVDVLPAAAECAAANARRAGMPVDVRCGDLFAPVGDARYDRILFNAPFHLGEPRDALERALFGGRDGETIRRFARELPRHLQPGGEARVLLGAAEAEALLPGIAAETGLVFTVRASAWAPLLGEIRVYGWRPR